jgi:HD-GYP domain-containing protein (c-di-GMP phosphodiesterase class II)
VGELRLFYQNEFDRLIDDLNERANEVGGRILLLHEPLPPKQAQVIGKLSDVLCFAVQSEYWKNHSWPDYIIGFVSNPNSQEDLNWALQQSRMILDLKHSNIQLGFRLERERAQAFDVLESALELTAERHLGRLCEKVLSRLRKLAQAEGASLFIVDSPQKILRFKHVQNESVSVEWKEIALPIDSKSIVGHTVITGEFLHFSDVYQIESSSPFQFNKSFDERTGYRTKALLSIPLKKLDGEVVGVVQLINSKRSTDFSAEDVGIAKALSSHIAVALETALLYSSIENLFEGFIRASVAAIESRDPTTSGHSERVAILTVGLAEAVSDSSQPAFKSFRFGQKELREIRYASLLHDFGKIGVPEDILVKQKKLFDYELRDIEHRLQLLELLKPQQAEEWRRAWKQILEANEPTVLVEELKHDLAKWMEAEFELPFGAVQVLKPNEFERLSVKKGSLSLEERKQIESHVLHSFKFLEKIPWTRELQRIPEIAIGHHERLDGTGYPHGLKGDQIPMESQIMAVADVFDALTATDRPYKRSVPLEKALEILALDAKDFKLSKELVQLFSEQRIYDRLKSENSWGH